MLRDYRDLPGSIYVLCLGSLINRAGAMLIPFLTIYLRSELGTSVTFATWTIAVYGGGSLAAAIAGGHLADIAGRRPVMILSLVGGAFLIALWSLVKTPWAILSVAFLCAFVFEMYRPAVSAMIADLTDGEHRTRAFSLLYVSANLGFAVAPVAGGILAQWSYRWIFLGDALTSLAYGILIALFIRERAGRTRLTPAAGSMSSALRTMAKDRAFGLFCLSTLLVASVYVQATSTLPLVLSGLGFSAAAYGRLIALNGILIVVFQLPLTSLVSGLDRGRAMMVGAILIGIGFGLHGLAESTGAIAVAIAVWTTGEMIMAALGGAIVSDLAPEELRARYMGVFTFFYTAAIMIGPPLGGVILAHSGPDALWAACLGTGLVCALFFREFRACDLKAEAPGELPCPASDFRYDERGRSNMRTTWNASA